MSQRSVTPQTAPPRLYFRVPPEPSHLLRARERLRDYLRQYCTAHDVIDDCVLCVEEACTNAIRHSGAGDDIEIALQFEADQLVAQVKDRGRGFDTASFDPQHSPDPSADHGRGLFIMAALMDSLELRLEGGLEVRMARRAAPRCEPQALESGLAEPRATTGTEQRDARTRALLEEIDEAFFALDWEYRYVHANRAALRVAGKPLEELLGRTPWEAFPSLQGSLLQEHYRDAMELGVPSVFEHRSVATGDWLEIRIYPTPAGVSAYYREINERKHKEDERERLVAELQDRSAELHERTVSLARRVTLDESLERINRLIYSTLEFDEIMQRALDEAREALGADAGSIEMREEGAWSVRYQRGVAMPSAPLRLSDAEAPIATRAALSREPLAVKDLLLESETDVAYLREQQLRSALAVPLIVRDAVIGCLLFHDREPRVFTPAELDYAKKLGSSVSLALENARLSERETDVGRFDEAVTWSRATQIIRRLRAHPWRVLVVAIATQSAILAALDTEQDTRHVLGLPGSMIALISVVAGALAGPIVGAVVAVAGGVAFFMTVGGYGSQSTVWTTAISTGIWLTAGLVSGFLAKGLREQAERRRAASVALARADAARDVQLADQRRVEELAEELQVQTRDLQASGEELEVQAEELRERSEEVAARAALAEALNAINGVVHSTLDFDDIMGRALAQGVAALDADAGAIELREEESWVLACQHGFSGEEVGLRLSVEQAPIASRAWLEMEPFAIADMASLPSMNAGFAHSHGLRSVLAVPLIVRKAVIGCLLFYGRRPRSFTEAEIDFARKLGVTVSLAVDNARLYLDQQRIAQTLQENFIHELPAVAGLELGVVATTAYEPELVGGDFSDVFVLDDTHVVLLIADVAGKGVRAAGHTETVRSKLRAFATVDPSPACILAKTNEVLLRFDPDEPHVTAFLAVLDPRTGHLSYASAGHPAPVHLGAFSCRLLDVPFGPPLGSFERTYANAHAMLTLEDYLVLYTDGVTEARRDGELLGAERLLEVVSGLRGRSAQEVAEGVRDAALAFAGRLRDDLQVVVLRLA